VVEVPQLHHTDCLAPNAGWPTPQITT